MKEVDPSGWAEAKRDSSPVERHIAQQAEAWADLMEAEMAGGHPLEEVAEEADRKASAGSCFGSPLCVVYVQILAEEWKYGAELEAWFYANDALAWEKCSRALPTVLR